MNYVGVDLHKETSWFCVLDSKGKKVSSKNVSNNVEILKKYFKSIPKPFKLAVETTYNWYFMLDMAEIYAEKIYLANSYELKAFAKRNKKTDKIDAKLIASILHKGFLPTVTIPNKNTRETREFLNYRVKLVTDRSRNIFRLKALLDKLGLDSTGDFTTYKALDLIEAKNISETYTNLIQKYCDRISFLTNKLSEIEKEVNQLAKYDLDVQNLLTIPGIGPFSALLIKAEIIDINRFKSFDRLCSYAGLAPRVSASANKIHHGSLNKNRRKNLQWILLENAYHFIKADPQRFRKFEILKKRKGHNTAKVNFAREFLKVVYHVLKEHRPYFKTKIQSIETIALKGV